MNVGVFQIEDVSHEGEKIATAPVKDVTTQSKTSMEVSDGGSLKTTNL